MVRVESKIFVFVFSEKICAKNSNARLSTRCETQGPFCANILITWDFGSFSRKCSQKYVFAREIYEKNMCKTRANVQFSFIIFFLRKLSQKHREYGVSCENFHEKCKSIKDFHQNVPEIKNSQKFVKISAI